MHFLTAIAGEPSPGADMHGCAVLVPMWEGCAQSRCRCGRGAPSPGADVEPSADKGRGAPWQFASPYPSPTPTPWQFSSYSVLSCTVLTAPPVSAESTWQPEKVPPLSRSRSHGAQLQRASLILDQCGREYAGCCVACYAWDANTSLRQVCQAVAHKLLGSCAKVPKDSKGASAIV